MRLVRYVEFPTVNLIFSYRYFEKQPIQLVEQGINRYGIAHIDNKYLLGFFNNDLLVKKVNKIVESRDKIDMDAVEAILQNEHLIPKIEGYQYLIYYIHKDIYNKISNVDYTVFYAPTSVVMHMIRDGILTDSAFNGMPVEYIKKGMLFVLNTDYAADIKAATALLEYNSVIAPPFYPQLFQISYKRITVFSASIGDHHKTVEHAVLTIIDMINRVKQMPLNIRYVSSKEMYNVVKTFATEYKNEIYAICVLPSPPAHIYLDVDLSIVDRSTS